MTVYNDTIAENLSITPAQGYVYRQYGVLSESLKAFDLMAGARGQNASIAENLTITPAQSTQIGLVLAENLLLTQGEVVNQKSHLTMVEQMLLNSNLSSAWPITISENIAITPTQLVQRAVSVIEALALVDIVVPSIKYHMSISESLLVSSALARFMSASVIENLLITPAIDPRAFKTAQVGENLTIADQLTPRFILRVTAADTLSLSANQALKMIFNAEIDEQIEIAGAYLAPNGSVTTWVMNTRSGGVTEYQNYAFNSFARVGNKYIAAADDGLYELLGDKDDGDDIIATIRSGFAQWSGTHLGSFKAAYLAVAGAGTYVLRVLTRDGKTYNYQVTAADGRSVKVNMGKGLRSRYFAFELVSSGQDFDLDTLEFIPLVADRRV